MKVFDRGFSYELNPVLISVNESENFGKYRGFPIRIGAIIKLNHRGDRYLGL